MTNRWPVLLLAGAMLVAACGDDDETQPVSSTASTETSEAAATTAAPPSTTEAAATTAASTTEAATTTEATTTTETTTTTTAPEVPVSLWATDSRGGTVYRLDPETGAVLAEIAVAGGPEAIAFGGGSVWVVDNLEGAVVRIDAADGRLLEVIPVGENTAGIAFAEGLVFAGNFGTGPDFAGTVAVIDPATSAVTEVIDVPAGPTGMVVGPDGAVYGATFRDPGIYRIDPATLAVTTAELGMGPLDVGAVGGEIWVADIDTGTVHRVEPGSLEIIGEFPLADPQFVSGGGGYGWVSGASLWAVEAGTGDTTDFEVVGPTSVQVTADAAYVAGFDGRIHRIAPPSPDGEATVIAEIPGAALWAAAVGNGY